MIDALIAAHREDLIGTSPSCLVPPNPRYRLLQQQRAKNAKGGKGAKSKASARGGKTRKNAGKNAGKRGRLIAALCIAAAVISLIMTILGAWERIFELFGYKEDLNSPSSATVSFLSVKAADCCILSSAGRHMMIDCGGDETSGTAVKYMDLNGVERLDILFITHFDSDHSELLPQIAENVEIGKS